jgi:hypothetical protein
MFRLRRRTFVTVGLGMVMTLGLALPVSAEVIVSDRGNHGEAHFFDSAGFPGGTCGYGAENSLGFAYFKWMKLLGPSIKAYDRTAGVDHQQVIWKFMLQRKKPGHPYTTVGTASQTRTAYDNSFTTFGTLKVYANGVNGDLFRAISLVKWMRNDSVDGSVKARIQYYGVKWTVGSPDYVFTDACTGRAD